MKSLAAFIRLSRPHFLLGGALMFAIGAAAVRRPISVRHYLIGQLMITAAQITAHYVNEHADYDADLAIANRTAFSGGSGVLTSGALPRLTALRAGQVSTLVALSAAGWVATFSLAAAALGILALCVSWAYSMPPVRLLNTGAGELVTAVTVAGLVPLAGSLCQRGFLPTQLWWIIGVLMAMQFAMLLAFEFPDLDSDAAAGKRVLGVRIGYVRTLRLIALLVVVAAVIDVVGWAYGSMHGVVALRAWICAPTAVAQFVALRTRHFGRATFYAVASFFLCGLGFFIAELSIR